MVLYSFHRFGDCDHLYVILYEVDNYPNIEDRVYYIVKCCQLAIFTPRRQIFPPCFKGKTISTSKLCSTKTSQAYSSFVLMKVRHIFDRVCLQRVHFSFLRTLTCLKVQLLYIIYNLELFQ
jgi:hypothetical protein